MATSAKLIIDPKKWLGDNKVLKMDWDVRAMHFHLMLISWQNNPQACIEADHNIIGKYLAKDPNSIEWKSRIWPQLKTSWEEVFLEVNGVNQKFYKQPGLYKEIEKQVKTSTKKTVKKPVKSKDGQSQDILSSQNNHFNIDLNDDHNSFEGFLLENLSQDKNLFSAPRRFDASTVPTSIWELGVGLIASESFPPNKAKGFLIKLAKEYGSQELAATISMLGMKKINPIDAKAYLIGALKKNAAKEQQFVKHNQAGGLVL